MTMSVGLAKIQNDPKASVLIRKALGALSTPGLLVYDTGLSIDNTGRIVLKLKENGGLLQDEDGLYLQITVGIDSHVDLDSDEYDREWNARLTGTAPNFMQGSLAIGTEEFGAVSPTGAELQDAKVQITSTMAQLRLSHDPYNFTAFRTLSDGSSEFYAVGSNPSFNFYSGDGTYNGNVGGIRINNGTEIQQIITWTFTGSFAGGGVLGAISWEEILFSIPSDSGYELRPGQDVVTVMPKNSVTLPNEWLAYTGRISATDRVSLRVCWYDVVAADARQWIFLIHRMKA